MRKRILLGILLAAGHVMFCAAQSWKMVITKHDGTTLELNTAVVKDISFVEEKPPMLTEQNADQIIIKELYTGGCPMDTGSDAFFMDKCIILYNNCPQQAVVNNLCFAFATPYNSEAPNNKIYDGNGKLVYEDDGFIPALNGFWYYPGSLVFEPWSQIVINVTGAIDNTQTYSQSVNYANPDYYCMYDPQSGYANTLYYPAPADVIPATHYLKAVKYGQANAWPLSHTSPALFLFQVEGATPMEFGTNADNLWYAPGEAHDAIHACVKVPTEWIIDAVEVFNAAKKDDNKKRFTADVDAGYVLLTNKLGHTLYRNVDVEETKALAENDGKIIYDSNNIDAEASIRNGAHIVFLDTNNSSEDFYERDACSLRNTFATTR